MYSNTFQILEYLNFNSIKLNSSIITIQIKRLKFKFVYFRNPTYSNTRIFKFNFNRYSSGQKASSCLEFSSSRTLLFTFTFGDTFNVRIRDRSIQIRTHQFSTSNTSHNIVISFAFVFGLF